MKALDRYETETTATETTGAQDIAFEAVERCPVCGESERTVIFTDAKDHLYALPDAFRYVECANCRLVYQDPRPTEADLPKCYASYHTHETETLPESFTGEWSKATRLIRGGVLAHKFGYRHFAPSQPVMLLASLLDVLPPVRSRARCGLGVGAGSGLPVFKGDGRALDIGTGSGIYAATLARLGWDVTCVEFDEVAARSTSERHKLKVHAGTLEDARFADESFDFVSMFHVIEHLPDPIAVLRECRRVMRQGGRLMIRTPNFDSLTRRAFGRHWRGLEAPRHLCLFNPSSLKRALVAAGFRVEAEATPRAATRFYVESSARFRAEETGGEFDEFAVSARTKLQNAAVSAGLMIGRLLGDELHVEAVKR